MRKALLIVVVILVLDFLTKQLVRTHLDLHEVIPLTPFLNLVHVQNTGAAFGMFSSLGRGFFILVALTASVGIVIYMARVPDHRTILAMVLAGALGNLADRVFLGHVTDFVDVHIGRLHWPAFNVADSALTVSIALLLLSGFRKPSSQSGKKDEEGGVLSQ
ncbi:MAG: signal peptidase II [Thermodesulfobacteriota bacterium]